MENKSEININSDNKKKNVVCKYFKTGYCKFSGKCKFLHTLQTTNNLPILQIPSENFKDKKILINDPRENRKDSLPAEPSYQNNSLDHQSEAEQAKLKGNKSYMEGDYNKAYEMYSLAIIYSTEALATFYSNRSNTSIQLKEYYKALSDAEKCIDLRPNWTRGYYRKATCLMHLGDKESSQKYFKKSFESATTEKEREEIKKFINESGIGIDSMSFAKELEIPKNGKQGKKLLNFFSKFSNERPDSDSDSDKKEDSSVQDQLDFLISQFIKPHEDDAFRSLSVYHGLDSGELSQENALGWIKFGITYGTGDTPDLLNVLGEYVLLTKEKDIKEKLEEIYDLCGFL